MGKEADAVGGEEFAGGDTAEGAQEVAIGGPQDVGKVVAIEFAAKEAWAIGEDDVVFREAILGGRGGGDDEEIAGSEAEEEDGAVAVGEGG